MTVRPGNLIAVALALSACSGGGDEVAPGPAAPAAAAGSSTDPRAGGCPSTVVTQGGWFQTMDIGVPFQLLGDDHKVDTDKKRVSGSLVVDGRDTGVDLEFRARGPAVGFQNGPAVAAQDPSITLDLTNLDEMIAGILTAQHTAVPADLTADTLATNDHLDKTKRLPSAAPSWASSGPSRS